MPRLSPMRQENYEKPPEARLARALRFCGLMVPMTNIEASLALKTYIQSGPDSLRRYRDWKAKEKTRRRWRMVAKLLKERYPESEIRSQINVSMVITDAQRIVDDNS